jgi:integrase
MAKSSEITKSIEHPEKSGIRILTVDNATSGTRFGVSYQVSIPAKVSGKGRIRKQFPTFTDAKKFASKEHRGATKEGEAYFRLTAKEKKEIGIKVPELRKKGISITEAIDFALYRLKPTSGEQLLSDVVQELQQSKLTRYDKGDLAKSSLKDFNDRSSRLAKDLGDKLIHEIEVHDVKKWTSSIQGSNRTRMNFLRIASEIFRYAKHKQYLRENPIEYLSDNDRKEIHGRLIHGGEIKVLSVEQADSFINFTADKDPKLLAVVTLGLFCGIRTEELKHITWDKVNMTEGYVTIDAAIAKKRRIRHVDIPENAKDWLVCCRNKQGKVAPATGRQFENLLRQLRLKAGYEDKKGHSTWPSNAMRHSFGTYHYAFHGDSNKTSSELGHKADDDTLFNHYRALAKKSDGEKFFSIKPAASEGKLLFDFQIQASDNLQNWTTLDTPEYEVIPSSDKEF